MRSNRFGGRSPAESRLPEILEAIGDAVYAMDCEERILFANRKALELWGKRRDEVVGRRILDVFPGIADGEPYRIYREVIATRKPVHIETVAPAMGGRWIGLDARPTAGGGLVVAFRDIDERKRAEAALRDSEERFRMMLEALPVSAFVIRSDGTAEFYNKALRDYAGDPIGLDPKSRTALQHPDDRLLLEAARREGTAKGEEYTVEVRIRRHDGAYRWHRVHNRPIRLNGVTLYWLGTAMDINDMREANALLEQRVSERTAELEAANRRLAAQIEEREKAEAQLRQSQRMDAVGQLTSGVAHDFNNLLTAIIGNLEMLAPRIASGDERSARLLHSAQEAADRGARLTAQLLAFSRKQRLAAERIDLNRVVTGMSALLQSTIGATIRIETVPAEPLWPALADPSQIELVLLNLAINARDAMAGGGTITVETGNATLGPPHRPEEPPAGDYVMVAVADSGSGIEPDILDRVFEPFFTTKEVGKGSGLGLSQVLGVVQQLGGGVRIDTRPGRGTIVKVYLPRAGEAQQLGGAEIAAPASAQRAATGGGRARLVLLVDDDSDVRAVAAAMLQDAGYDVVEADSGYAALDRLADEGDQVELMIVDFAMPGLNGVEVARAAQRRRPSLPILFVTGFADTSLLAENVTPEQILQKPFRAAELAARVGRLLNPAGGRGMAVPLSLPPG
ncbi:MAG: PAS domain S-box protein [Alphaproteobacteria bacterium]|nr:PAS domain S-box protein [Alphaproteobacteria bacterium]